ncbi:tail fiber assembly protein [Escherichia coli]|nr:tail fiber assembly protein [Escherichia coli]
MNSHVWSALNVNFYPVSIMGSYINAGVDLSDAVEIDDSIVNIYRAQPPAGKMLGVVDGKPGWIDVPPPTPEEMAAAAENERLRRIDDANDFMDSRQWPGKAAIGRLKDADLAQYNLWLDYLDALYAVDASAAPDINWPIAPAV